MYLAGLGSGYPFAGMRLLLCRFVHTSLPRQVHDKGGGNQGAVPVAVFAALEAWAGVQARRQATAAQMHVRDAASLDAPQTSGTLTDLE